MRQLNDLNYQGASTPCVIPEIQLVGSLKRTAEGIIRLFMYGQGNGW